MKDFFKEELAIGDTVAFYAPGYRSFCVGKIIRFTPQKVVVEYNNTWNYHNGHIETYTREPRCFIKKK